MRFKDLMKDIEENCDKYSREEINNYLDKLSYANGTKLLNLFSFKEYEKRFHSFTIDKIIFNFLIRTSKYDPIVKDNFLYVRSSNNDIIRYSLDNIDVSNGYYKFHPFLNKIIFYHSVIHSDLLPLTDFKTYAPINYYNFKVHNEDRNFVVGIPLGRRFSYIESDYNCYYNNYLISYTLKILKDYTPDSYKIGYNYKRDLIFSNKFLKVLVNAYE